MHINIIIALDHLSIDPYFSPELHFISYRNQLQACRGVLRESCSENMANLQENHPPHRCDFEKVAYFATY